MASTDLGHLQTAPATTPAVMHILLRTYTCVNVIHVNVVTANNKTHAIFLTLLKDHQTNIVFLYSTDNSYALLYSIDAADGHAHIYIYTYSMFITNIYFHFAYQHEKKIISSNKNNGKRKEHTFHTFVGK